MAEGVRLALDQEEPIRFVYKERRALQPRGTQHNSKSNMSMRCLRKSARAGLVRWVGVLGSLGLGRSPEGCKERVKLWGGWKRPVLALDFVCKEEVGKMSGTHWTSGCQYIVRPRRRKEGQGGGSKSFSAGLSWSWTRIGSERLRTSEGRGRMQRIAGLGWLSGICGRGKKALTVTVSFHT